MEICIKFVDMDSCDRAYDLYGEGIQSGRYLTIKLIPGIDDEDNIKAELENWGCQWDSYEIIGDLA